MSVLNTATTITNTELSLLPVVIAGVQAAQTTSASGEGKMAAVTAATIAVAQKLEANANPNVAGIAVLTEVSFQILKLLVPFFHHSSPAPAPVAPTPVVQAPVAPAPAVAQTGASTPQL